MQGIRQRVVRGGERGWGDKLKGFEETFRKIGDKRDTQFALSWQNGAFTFFSLCQIFLSLLCLLSFLFSFANWYVFVLDFVSAIAEEAESLEVERNERTT
mmetsp:Transcript_47233/g.93182  ORF Transcript_47233/g.93182 Transcript_47233/m.93182 type:complete len:100 (-) Transcript_47233:523-822(-)